MALPELKDKDEAVTPEPHSDGSTHYTGSTSQSDQTTTLQSKKAKDSDTKNFSEEKVENSQVKDLVNSANFGTDRDLRWKFRNLLQMMIDQEKEECEKKNMEDVIYHLKRCPWSPLSRDFCREKIGEWVTDRLPPPPPVERIKFEKSNGKLIVTWTTPQWPFPLCYSGEYVQSSGKGEVEPFENIAETSYELSNVSPTQGYVVTVWAVDTNGHKGKKTQSCEGMLCEKYNENLFVDVTSPLRSGYEVYKGYLRVASSFESVAVKVMSGKVHEKTLRETRALQELKYKNIVTYRLDPAVVKVMSGKVHEKTLRETRALQELKHKNIVTCLSETITEACGGLYCIAKELCCTDAFQELVKDKKLNMHCCKISLLHMMLGLAAIHKAGFLHRDLKPQNILRSLDGKDMKVAGFGLCKEMDPNKSKVSKSALDIGTDGWGSPEHYEPNAKMSVKSDIYSGGLVAAFGLSQGKHVYGSKANDWKLSIIEGRKVDLSILACDDYVQSAKDMISKMLQRDPDKRPTAKQVLAHPLFWDDEKKLNFLHRMSSFFTPIIFGKVTSGQLTNAIMNDLKTKKSIFQTEYGETNWVKKMKETPGVCAGYKPLLSKAQDKHARYDPTSVFFLLKFIGNVAEDYEDEDLPKVFECKCDIWKFFYKYFPTLLCTVYNAVYTHFPEIESCQEFPNDAAKFFTEPAHYESLPVEEQSKSS